MFKGRYYSNGKYYGVSTTGVSPAYTTVAIGFNFNFLILENDSDEEMQYSFDGTTQHGRLKVNEFKTLEQLQEGLNGNGNTNFYIKSTTGGKNIAITAW